MKFITTVLLATFWMLSIHSTVLAENASANPPEVRGEAAYLIDLTSGQTLFAKNADKLLAPASTTKIMTGLLAIEHGNMDDIVTASSTMLNNKLVYGTQIYLEPGEKMKFQDLLYAILLNSANDAAIAIAEHIGGDVPYFVDMMNQRALEIGATQTHFINPSGLTDTGHLTTAHDLALIARVAYQNPVFAQYVRTKTQAISRSKSDVPVLMVNQNKLLWSDAYVDGIKTGYTSEAQNCFVGSVSKGGRQFIGVTLKCPEGAMWTDMQTMFEYGFTQFETTVFKPSGAVISSIEVNNQSVDLILDNPIYRTQKLNGQNNELDLRVIPFYNSALNSIQKGQVVAQIEVWDENTLINTFPLKSSRTILPQSPEKNVRSNSLFWIFGILLFVVLQLVLGIKRNIARNRRRQERLRRRRQSN